MSGIGSINCIQSIPQLLSTQNVNSTQPDNDGDNDASKIGSVDQASSTGTASSLGNLRNQILAAVSDAVGKLDKSSSPADIVAAIQSAMQNTLKQNGIDPTQFQQGPGASAAHHHHHHRVQAAGSQGGSNAGSPMNAIDQILQQNGFDPNQVKQYLASQSPTPSSSTNQDATGNQYTEFLSLLQGVIGTPGVDTKA